MDIDGNNPIEERQGTRLYADRKISIVDEQQRQMAELVDAAVTQVASIVRGLAAQIEPLVLMSSESDLSFSGTVTLCDQNGNRLADIHFQIQAAASPSARRVA